MSSTGGELLLDAAATAPLRPSARAAMLAVWDAGQANPESVHQAGYFARTTLENARAQIAAGFGARSTEVIFTSGGTEANTLALVGLALANPRGRHIVTTAIEHPSVLESCRFLERMHGFDVTLLPVTATGRVDPEVCAAALRPDTTLLSIGLANAEIGTVQSITELAAPARALGVLVHTDAVQAAATLPISFGLEGWPGSHVDAMSVAGHKLGGPQGSGALFLRSHIPVQAVLHGGGQERGLRSGTHNVAGIAGFGAAVAAAAPHTGATATALIEIRDQLIAAVLRVLPEARLTGHRSERLPGHASFVVPGVSGESMLVALDTVGVRASSGSACAAGSDEPSPVLLAIGETAENAQTAIRFTLPPHGFEQFTPAAIALIARTIATEVAVARRKQQP